MGVLGWAPETFWRSTMHELMSANHGYIKAHKVPDDDDKPATKDDFEMLKNKLAARRIDGTANQRRSVRS